MPAINKTIQYLRQCYQGDNRGLHLPDFFANKVSHQLFFEGEEKVLTGFYEELPLLPEYGEKILAQKQLYLREKMLVLGALFMTGNIAGGFKKGEALCAPFFVFPVEIKHQGEYYYYSVDFARRQINRLVLLQALGDIDHKEDLLLELEEELGFGPLDYSQVVKVVNWMETYLPEANAQDALLYPKLESLEALEARYKSKEKTLCLSANVGMSLVDRSESTQGILADTRGLQDYTEEHFSAPIRELLGDPIDENAQSADELHHAPAILNPDQEKILANAGTLPLSVVQGPPGTGKTYTIAAIALDHMFRGESVLIATRNPEALDVVGEKLMELAGVSDGEQIVMRVGKGSYGWKMRTKVQKLLMTVSKLPEVSKKAKESQRQEEVAKRLYAHAAKVYEKQTEKEQKYGPWVEPPYPEGYAWWKQLWMKTKANAHVRKSKSERGIFTLLNNFLTHQDAYLKARQKNLIESANHHVLKQVEKNYSMFNSLLAALKAGRSGEIAKHMEAVDMKVITKAMPIWLVNLNEVHVYLPLQKELFDLVIIDEATQCDITSVLPVLQRGKRGVVVGDTEQLRHISFLSQARQEVIAKSLGLSLLGLPDYRNTSVLDLVIEKLSRAGSMVLLQEHYRSHPSLISFSNEHIYQNMLKVMTDRPYVQDSRLHRYTLDAKRDRKGVNKEEAEKVIQQLEMLVAGGGGDLEPIHTIGVLSPLSEQAGYLAKLISQRLSPAQISKHKIMVGTPFAFQGAERDYMLISLGVGKEEHHAVWNYFNRTDMFNVAVTRAKNHMWVFFSGDEEELPHNGMLKKFLDHMLKEKLKEHQNPEEEDEFLGEVKAAFEEYGWEVFTHFVLAGILIDLVVKTDKGFFGIDLVGYEGLYYAALTLHQHSLLHRAGIQMVTLPYSLWVADRRRCLRYLGNMKGS